MNCEHTSPQPPHRHRLTYISRHVAPASDDEAAKETEPYTIGSHHLCIVATPHRMPPTQLLHGAAELCLPRGKWFTDLTDAIKRAGVHGSVGKSLHLNLALDQLHRSCDGSLDEACPKGTQTEIPVRRVYTVWTRRECVQKALHLSVGRKHDGIDGRAANLPHQQSTRPMTSVPHKQGLQSTLKP